MKKIFPVFFVILSMIMLFGLLEMYARYKYFGGTLREKGFRFQGEKYTIKKQTPYRIVCVGNDFTSGIRCTHKGVDINQTYPFYLEQFINKEMGKDFVEVINSGIMGRSTGRLRDFIKEKTDDNHQELDMIMLCSTDNPDCYDYKTIYHWENITSPEAINSFLMEHSFFYTRTVEKIAKTRGGIDAYYADKPKKSLIQRVPRDKKKDEYYKAVEDIIVFLKSRNIDIVLIIPPALNSPWSDIFEKSKQCLIALGRKHSLLVIDTDKGFSKLEKRGKDLFCDASHLSPEGNYFIARLIASELAPYLKKRFPQVIYSTLRY